jgi:hypothetical protein
MQKLHPEINVFFKVAALFLLASLSIEGAFAEQQCRSVYIDGIKVGHGFYERKTENGLIVTYETLSLKTKQPDTYYGHCAHSGDKNYCRVPARCSISGDRVNRSWDI